MFVTFHLFRLNLRVLSAIALRVGLDTRTTCSGFRTVFGSVWSRMEMVFEGVQESWRRYRRMDQVIVVVMLEFSQGLGELSAALSLRNEILRKSEVLKCDLFHAVNFSHTHNWTFTSSELTCEF